MLWLVLIYSWVMLWCVTHIRLILWPVIQLIIMTHDATSYSSTHHDSFCNELLTGNPFLTHPVKIYSPDTRPDSSCDKLLVLTQVQFSHKKIYQLIILLIIIRPVLMAMIIIKRSVSLYQQQHSIVFDSFLINRLIRTLLLYRFLINTLSSREPHPRCFFI